MDVKVVVKLHFEVQNRLMIDQTHFDVCSQAFVIVCLIFVVAVQFLPLYVRRAPSRDFLYVRLVCLSLLAKDQKQ